MPFTQSITQTWTDGNTSLTKTVSKSAGSELKYSETIADGATNLPLAIAFDRDKLLLLYMVSDQDLTIETNSSSTPADTILLKAGQPLVYLADSHELDGTELENPFDASVTGFFISNASGAAAALEIRGVVDPT